LASARARQLSTPEHGAHCAAQTHTDTEAKITVLNADQLDRAARAWHQENSYADYGFRREAFYGGPYHVLMTGPTNRGGESYADAATRRVFAGVDIPYLDQRGWRVVTGFVSMYVVPQTVYTVVGPWSRNPNGLLAALEPAPFANPPTEADLGGVFVQAMTRSGGTDCNRMWARRKATLDEACTQLGWRTVAALINTMDASARTSSGKVTAILKALIAEPAATSGRPTRAPASA